MENIPSLNPKSTINADYNRAEDCVTQTVTPAKNGSTRIIEATSNGCYVCTLNPDLFQTQETGVRRLTNRSIGIISVTTTTEITLIALTVFLFIMPFSTTAIAPIALGLIILGFFLHWLLKNPVRSEPNITSSAFLTDMTEKLPTTQPKHQYIKSAYLPDEAINYPKNSKELTPCEIHENNEDICDQFTAPLEIRPPKNQYDNSSSDSASLDETLRKQLETIQGDTSNKKQERLTYYFKPR